MRCNDCVLTRERRGGSDTDTRGRSDGGCSAVGGAWEATTPKTLHVPSTKTAVLPCDAPSPHPCPPPRVWVYLTVPRAQIPRRDVDFALHVCWQGEQEQEEPGRSTRLFLGTSLLSFTLDTASRAVLALSSSENKPRN